MNFNSARLVEQLVWQLRLADYPRDLNRARINSLANGDPPYSLEEAEKNGIEVNVNDLAMTRLTHEARLQLMQGFNKPGNYFTARTDMGPVHLRNERGVFVTNRINRIMKRSDPYFECQRSKFALNILHGIGPSYRSDADHWCPEPIGVEDVMMPSNTLLSFRGLPFFAIWKSYTGKDLRRLSRDTKHNPGWNPGVIEKAIKWIDNQTHQLYGGTTWAEYWVPSKWQERWKQDSGIYASDLAPTVDVWDFYYWDDEGGEEGWRRRMIFDAEGGYSAFRGKNGYGGGRRKLDKNFIESKDDFLYSSKNRVVASHMNEIVHFQFADLSAVGPFRYHSIRSLGFLLFSVCHLQNRLRCSFSEAVFENLLMYMRVNSLDDAERALKIELANRGIIDQSVHFLTPAERWIPNPQLAELGLNEYKQIIADNSSSYLQQQNFARDRTEKTKFQVMAEVQAMQTLVSASLQQAYRYETTDYRTILGRFMRKDSRDPDVREFRAACIKRGIPENMMTVDAWDIEPERVLGGGNRTLEMAIAQQLMEWRPAFAPEAQQVILRDAVLAITDDSSKSLALVPHSPTISNARQTAMLAFGSLLAGTPVLDFTADQNRIEIAETLIGELGLALQKVAQTGNMATMQQVQGFQNVLGTISKVVAHIAKDRQQKERAKDLAQKSGKLANLVKALGQRLVQQMRAAQQRGGNGQMAETMEKVRSQRMLSQAKAENMRLSRAERAAERQAEFELRQKQDEQKHAQELRHNAQRAGLEIATDRARAANEAFRNRFRNMGE